MTRINAFIPPADLCDKHLLAEHREIKRIPNQIKAGRFNLKSIPDKFTLGKGHVAFFYNKLGYLLERYRKIHEECLNRGFNVSNYLDSWKNIPPELNQEWFVTEEERRRIIHIMVDRIVSKTPRNAKYTRCIPKKKEI
jgi:cell fate regulator YaaT (PSP1 superfamily)